MSIAKAREGLEALLLIPPGLQNSLDALICGDASFSGYNVRRVQRTELAETKSLSVTPLVVSPEACRVVECSRWTKELGNTNQVNFQVDHKIKPRKPYFWLAAQTV